MIHIYTESRQPATCWTDSHSGKDRVIRLPANRLLYVRCCGRRRPAKNCVVQVYYDGLYIWCAAGKGCKDPRVIAARERLQFRNRSKGQIARNAKRRLQILIAASEL